MNLKDDALRSRFTAWMKVVVRRIRVNYIKSMYRFKNEISIDAISESGLYEDREIDITDSSKLELEFSDEHIAQAFTMLSKTRQKILTMLFVREMNPEEIAMQLNCSVQNIYNQRSYALKQLKGFIEGNK